LDIEIKLRIINIMNNFKELLIGAAYIGCFGMVGYVTIELITKAVGVGS